MPGTNDTKPVRKVDEAGCRACIHRKGGGMHEKINMNTASLHINQSTQWPLIVMIILRN